MRILTGHFQLSMRLEKSHVQKVKPPQRHVGVLKKPIWWGRIWVLKWPTSPQLRLEASWSPWSMGREAGGVAAMSLLRDSCSSVTLCPSYLMYAARNTSHHFRRQPELKKQAHIGTGPPSQVGADACALPSRGCRETTGSSEAETPGLLPCSSQPSAGWALEPLPTPHPELPPPPALAQETQAVRPSVPVEGRRQAELMNTLEK
ncbi:Hypothetical predicted protein [Marmota monax]|uniref:Uncharacterized protein n=1 Tax=Marmota monax TaxID=9995 RepID=A0A5E4ARC4_MARMO|nr:hypothetical protein GHT09_009823 [Marmota monax]VTJ60043.1 Hypothetical predicted protein [Marmota monax]